ncbi:MAG: patatin-like phospholipase family protein [Saprospiraceae bacterium]|nr:patatin-like phospholipase family protein [Saprospiraceae bacterium]
MRTLQQHFDPKLKPKRILALDGGGIRGALTLGYLKKIESLLREKEEDPDLLLCDYFDLICGTSTGSIIAAGLALGMDVDSLVNHYMDLGGKIFGEREIGGSHGKP